ncbi:MAG TPA: VOC family protein [Alphaproteobacteria bacterium]|nr:VOC family protein [Alphaproteobacteria bacterium]
MTNAITGLDHAVIVVRDLDDAQAKFQKLGFTLTARGRHTGMGTANHCIMLGNRNYFELLAVIEPNPTNALFREKLTEREGLMAHAWQTKDARAVGKAWAEAGLAPMAPIEFGRPVDTAEGRKDAKFCVVQLAPDRLPGMMGFACQHFTPEVVWLPGTLDHPNGARTIVGVAAVAERPAELAEIYGRALGKARVKREADGLLVDSGTAPIRFVTPARFAATHGGVRPDPRIKGTGLVGLALAVASLDATKKLLDANGVPHVQGEHSVVVPPEHGCGAIIEFVQG